MSLKQINPEDRIVFLKKFVKEVLISLEEPRISKKIEIEKLKQKIFEPVEPEKNFEQSISTSFFQSPIYAEKAKELSKMYKKVEIIKKPLFSARRLFRRAPPKKIPVRPLLAHPHIQRVSQTLAKTNLGQHEFPEAEALKEIKPEPQARPEGFALGKLGSLLKDVTIQSIECPGPGKNVLVKRYNKVNVTKINLNQPEITDIIDDFSKKARIPVVGGILKAAVGDLVISAVISDFIGSRFIINKIAPYGINYE